MKLNDFQKIYIPHPSVPSQVMKVLAFALVAAAAAAALAAIISRFAQSRFHRKLMNCADSIQGALPTLRHAAELYIAEHAPELPDDESNDLPF